MLTPNNPQTNAAPLARSGPVQLRHVGRQPIFDRDQVVYAYELLFRSSGEAQSCVTNNDAATLRTIDFNLLMGSDTLTDGRRAFLNCTREILVDELVTTLPQDFVVLEVLENIAPDSEVVDACRRLRKSGYMLALDDYDESQDLSALMPLASFVKVDFKLTTPEQQADIARRLARPGLHLLAEKVETREEFHRAREAGYTYFQGYFFCKPATMSTVEIPCLQANYFQVLRTAYECDMDFHELETAIKREPALCYRLLRYLNSPLFALAEVNSVRHALSLLGARELRKWLTIVAVIDIASQNCAELIILALARGRFCEQADHATAHGESDLFLLGMLSLIDALLDRPLNALLPLLPVTEQMRSALLGGAGHWRDLLDLAIACERGDWSATQRLASALPGGEDAALDAYRESLDWARELCRHTL